MGRHKVQEKWLQTNVCLYKISNAAIHVLHSWIWCSNFLEHYNMSFDFGRFCYGRLFKIITETIFFHDLTDYIITDYSAYILVFVKMNQDGIPLYLPYFPACIYCLSLQGRNGSDMIILKVFMRHKNINSTAIYVHLSWRLFLLFQAPTWKNKRDAVWRITE